MVSLCLKRPLREKRGGGMLVVSTVNVGLKASASVIKVQEKIAYGGQGIFYPRGFATPGPRIANGLT
jgi:hypothetical protein